MNAASDTKVSVWDPLVRVGHWALVAAFAIAYLTGEEEGEPSDWHEWAGYIAGGIVVWRVLWGFAGPKYARFSDFAVWPRSALTYLIDLIAGRSRRYVGHSPAGGVMIIALLAFIGTTVTTGIVADPVGNAPKDQASVTAATPIKTGEVQGSRPYCQRKLHRRSAWRGRQYHARPYRPSHFGGLASKLRPSRKPCGRDDHWEKACGRRIGVKLLRPSNTDAPFAIRPREQARITREPISSMSLVWRPRAWRVAERNSDAI